MGLGCFRPARDPRETREKDAGEEARGSGRKILKIVLFLFLLLYGIAQDGIDVFPSLDEYLSVSQELACFCVLCFRVVDVSGCGVDVYLHRHLIGVDCFQDDMQVMFVQFLNHYGALHQEIQPLGTDTL